MAKYWEFKLCHTFKEENICVDWLVKLGIESTSDLLILLDPPSTEHRLLLRTYSMCVAYHCCHFLYLFFCLLFSSLV